MANFRSGDIVRLKSGGHAMTISSMIDNFSVNCTWATGGDVKTEIIRIEALEMFVPTKAPSVGRQDEAGKNLP